MKYKEFSEWCNRRACDGYWSIYGANDCIAILDDVNKYHFWQKEKRWNEICKNTKIIEYVNEINQMIDERNGMKRE